MAENDPLSGCVVKIPAMNDNKPTNVPFPWLAAACLATVLLLTGIAGPAYLRMLEDFGAVKIEPAWAQAIITWTHWGWTTPLGLAAAAILIRGSNHWPVKTTRQVGMAYLLLSLLILLCLCASVFMKVSVVPVPLG